MPAYLLRKNMGFMIVVQ